MDDQGRDEQPAVGKQTVETTYRTKARRRSTARSIAVIKPQLKMEFDNSRTLLQRGNQQPPKQQMQMKIEDQMFRRRSLVQHR